MLEIHGGVQGDDRNNSYVWIPSLETVIAGDLTYRGVHVRTAETKAADRKAWRKTLDEVAARKPTVVVAGHKDPKLDTSTAGIDQTGNIAKPSMPRWRAARTPTRSRPR